eukprot:6962533-Alexandrium_andersonii.AAC.1
MAGQPLSGPLANRVATTATSSASRCSSGLVRATWTEASAPGGGAARVRLGRRWGTASHTAAVSPREVREVRAVARRPFGGRWSREGLRSPASVPWVRRAESAHSDVSPQ